jgi:hypothetical protein
MKVDTAEELKAAYKEWRGQKKHLREAIPGELLDRTRRAIDVHGWGAIRKATKVEARRVGIKGAHASRGKRSVPTVVVPSFSRLELAAPVMASRPFAEVETSAGLKVRLFANNTEMVALLSALCGMGGGR